MAKAKTKELKYATLNKTANHLGAFAFTNNETHYVGNSYCVVFGMNDDEFNLAIDKAKADTEPKVDTAVITRLVSTAKEKGSDVAYTKVCYDSYDGMIHFFKIKDNNKIVGIDGRFFDMIKDQKIMNIIGTNRKSGVVFDLEDGKSILIMPKMVKVAGETGEYLDKILN